MDGDVGQEVPASIAPEPTPLAAGDVVPAFRSDLRVSRGASPGLFEVSDPRSGKRFVLYEFEFSIARLLDGCRRASEVVESGVRLGIPVDVGGLYKFVRQLWHYGFLAPPGAPSSEAEEGGLWPARERWDEATRTLFQTGMRLARQGRQADAAGYFEAVLDADPGNPEAIEMLSLIGQGTSLAANRIGEEMGRPEASGGRPAPGRGDAPGRNLPRSRRRLAVAAAVATGAGLGLALVVALQATGTVTPAAAVDTPPPMTAPEPEPPRPAPSPWLSAPVDRRWHPALAETLAPATGTVGWEREPGAAVAPGERLGSVKVSGPAAPDPETLRRIAELERLAAEDPVYEAFLEKERRVLRRASRGGRDVAIAGRVAGQLETLVADGTRIRKGTPIARIVEGGTWHASFALGKAPPDGAACELVGDGSDAFAPCRVIGATQHPRGVEVTVSLPAASAPWIAGARSLAVRIGPNPAALPPPSDHGKAQSP